MEMIDTNLSIVHKHITARQPSLEKAYHHLLALSIFMYYEDDWYSKSVSTSLPFIPS